jgi:hypothetical protein
MEYQQEFTIGDDETNTTIQVVVDLDIKDYSIYSITQNGQSVKYEDLEDCFQEEIFLHCSILLEQYREQHDEENVKWWNEYQHMVINSVF